jgi:hypothetical protein
MMMAVAAIRIAVLVATKMRVTLGELETIFRMGDGITTPKTLFVS